MNIAKIFKKTYFEDYLQAAASRYCHLKNDDKKIIKTIFSKLAIKTTKEHQGRRFSAFIVNSEYVTVFF